MKHEHTIVFPDPNPHVVAAVVAGALMIISRLPGSISAFTAERAAETGYELAEKLAEEKRKHPELK